MRCGPSPPGSVSQKSWLVHYFALRQGSIQPSRTCFVSDTTVRILGCARLSPASAEGSG